MCFLLYNRILNNEDCWKTVLLQPCNFTSKSDHRFSTNDNSKILIIILNLQLILTQNHYYYSSDHFAYAKHECPAPNTRNVQVPECPLCGKPVPGKRGEPPDVAVGAHIDNLCTSDPAKERRKKVRQPQISN